MELTSCEFFFGDLTSWSVGIWSFSRPYFSAFSMNMEEYSVSLCIQFECRKKRTRKTPNTDNFHAVSLLHISDCHLLDHVKWIVHLSSIFDGPYFMKAFPKVYFWTVFNKFFIPAIYMMNTISCDFSPKVQF